MFRSVYKRTNCVTGEQNWVVCLGNGIECNRNTLPPSLRWLLFSVGKFIAHVTEPSSYDTMKVDSQVTDAVRVLAASLTMCGIASEMLQSCVLVNTANLEHVSFYFYKGKIGSLQSGCESSHEYMHTIALPSVLFICTFMWFLGWHYADESCLLQACIPQNKAIMQTSAHIETFVKFMCDVYSCCSQLPYKYILWYLIAHVTVYCIRLQ